MGKEHGPGHVPNISLSVTPGLDWPNLLGSGFLLLSLFKAALLCSGRLVWFGLVRAPRVGSVSNSSVFSETNHNKADHDVR
jgi:hypothetical protein